MSTLLLEPQITCCNSEDVFQPRLSVMSLDWRGEPAAEERRLWDLPEGVTICSSAPIRFSICVQRRDGDCYAVRLVWNQTNLAWRALTRRQLLDCCLESLLAAIGTELEYLLDQPVTEPGWPQRGGTEGWGRTGDTACDLNGHSQAPARELR